LLLTLVSIALAKVPDNLGFPTLLLLLRIVMLVGSEGPGGIYFDDARLAQSIGIVARVFGHFAGGLDTKPFLSLSIRTIHLQFEPSLKSSRV